MWLASRLNPETGVPSRDWRRWIALVAGVCLIGGAGIGFGTAALLFARPQASSCRREVRELPPRMPRAAMHVAPNIDLELHDDGDCGHWPGASGQ